MNKENSIVRHTSKEYLDCVIDIMEDPSFDSFFSKYFDTFDNIKASIMIMKTCKHIQDKYYELYHKKLERDKMKIILREVFDNRECRKRLVESMNNFMKEDGEFSISMLEGNLIMDK